MDRYHLAWLMVGKPKAIVRGRPMTPDEEAAYVREVADAKTAALRMSLDAVERQGMPFVGEERGMAPGQGMGTMPGDRDAVTRPSDDPRRRRRARVPVPDPDRPRLPPPRAPARPARPGPRRRLLRPGRPQGARSTSASSRPPARLAGDAAALLARLAGEVDDDQRRDWLAAQLVALRTQAAALAGDELPYLEHVDRCFAWTPERRDDAMFEAAAAELDALLPGPGPLADRLAAWDARFEIPVERLPAVVDWLVGRFRARADACSACRRARISGSASSTNQPWSGYNWYDGGRRSRVDINTDLPVRAADARPHGRPRDVPRPSPRARLEGGRPRRWPRPARGERPAHQHARSA